MVRAQSHRGPDDAGTYVSPDGQIGLGHNRLSIIDLSPTGRQPMADNTGKVHIVFNGEIYNYLELKSRLTEYDYRSHSDTEVILAAYQKWGRNCLSHLLGMFVFIIWDEHRKELFAARDRFGVKPLYYSTALDGALLLSSEIKALHEAGVPRRANPAAWATYLTYGAYDHSDGTFWSEVHALPAGHLLVRNTDHVQIDRWYDLAGATEQTDLRSEEQVGEEYLALLEESVRLRFRSDVPVGLSLSGGLDSSTLLGLVHRVQGTQSSVKAYTFITGDPAYDETPWVNQLVAKTKHESVLCQLWTDDVPQLARSIQEVQDEPFGGIPTLAYAKVFETARQQGVIVLLDGQGMDEQWAGYDYYRKDDTNVSTVMVQGSTDSPVRPECLSAEFRKLSALPDFPRPYDDRLRNLQYRDICFTKLPRALRFNDRISMRVSSELREPFLDHRLVELALRQPMHRKISNGASKWFLRDLARRYLPIQLVEAPKRPVQTPQREWLQGPLRLWAEELITVATESVDGWLSNSLIWESWRNFLAGANTNSFFIWQWINLGLMKHLEGVS